MIQICGYRKYWTELSQPFAFVLILKGRMDKNDTKLWVQEVPDRIESAGSFSVRVDHFKRNGSNRQDGCRIKYTVICDS